MPMVARNPLSNSRRSENRLRPAPASQAHSASVPMAVTPRTPAGANTTAENTTSRQRPAMNGEIPTAGEKCQQRPACYAQAGRQQPGEPRPDGQAGQAHCHEIENRKHSDDSEDLVVDRQLAPLCPRRGRRNHNCDVSKPSGAIERQRRRQRQRRPQRSLSPCAARRAARRAAGFGPLVHSPRPTRRSDAHKLGVLSCDDARQCRCHPRAGSRSRKRKRSLRVILARLATLSMKPSNFIQSLRFSLGTLVRPSR